VLGRWRPTAGLDSSRAWREREKFPEKEEKVCEKFPQLKESAYLCGKKLAL